MTRTIAQDLVIDRDGRALRARVDGQAGGPTVLLANGLGLTLDMWGAQMPPLTRRFRVVRYDNRGHGGSAAPTGPLTLAQLAEDALAVLDAVGARRASVIGLSMGALVALWLAARHPDRIDKIVAANAGGAAKPHMWNQRIEAVTKGGMAAVAPGMAKRWFTPEFLAANPAIAGPIADALATTTPAGYAAGCAAVRDAEIHAVLPSIAVPALIIAGRYDQVTPPDQVAALTAAIPGARTVTLDAGHLSNVEQPQAFNRAVVDFLVAGALSSETDRYDLGMNLRRQVLGDDWVDGTLGRRTPFNAPFQDYITRYAWGEIWSRPGLEPFTRSCIALSICVALGRWDEFRLHVRAAFNNGLRQEEIMEVLMQTAVYAGVPAANTAFRHAEAVFDEMGL